MSEATRITRSVETDLQPDDLWALLTEGAAWATWMVDEADVDVRPGGGGTVVDDGVERTVRIDRLDTDGDACRVGFTWWPDDRPDLVSTVELVVLPAATGSRLHVTETYASAQACSASSAPAAAMAAPHAWDVRLVLLVAQALAVYV